MRAQRMRLLMVVCLHASAAVAVMLSGSTRPGSAAVQTQSVQTSIKVGIITGPIITGPIITGLLLQTTTTQKWTGNCTTYACDTTTTTTLKPSSRCGLPDTPPCPTTTTQPTRVVEIIPDVVAQTVPTVPTTLAQPVVLDNLRLDTVGASFGEVGVGATSAPREVVLVNSGSVPVRVVRASVPAPFALTGAGSCPSTSVLAAGQRCTYQVVFRPVAGVQSIAVVAIGVLAPSGDVTASAGVDGVGAFGRLAFVPPVVDHGDGAVGEKVNGTVQLKNVGSAPVMVKTVAAKKSSELILNVKKCVKVTLRPGATCTVGYAIIPKAGERIFTITATGSRKETGSVRLRRRALTLTTKPSGITTPPVTANTVPAATIAVFQPVLRMVPAVGPTGRVTTAVGSGFPANTTVELAWAPRPGISARSFTITSDATGAFRLPVLVLGGEPIGGRSMIVRDQPSFTGVRAPYLVQLATFRPPGQAGRSDRLVSRG